MAELCVSDIPDELTCPVCMQQLGDIIFQCRNGHIACETCLDFLEVCRQCRVSYESSPIRNLALENVLDQMSFKCKNTDRGCDAELCRKKILAHNLQCELGTPRVRFCRVVGFSCDDSLTNIDASHHVYTKHNVRRIGATKQLDLVLRDSRITNGENYRAVRKSWQPVLIKDDDSERELLIRVATWIDVDSYTMIVDVVVVNLSGFLPDDDIPVEIRSCLILSRSAEHKYESWTNKAISFTDCTQTLPMQSIRFQLNSRVVWFHGNEDFELKCVFRENPYFQPKSSRTKLMLDLNEEHVERYGAIITTSYFRGRYFVCLNDDGIKCVI